MFTVNSRQDQTLARLKRRLKRLGITHDRIAAAAEVHRTMVVKVLSGHAKSAKVLDAAKRMVEEVAAERLSA